MIASAVRVLRLLRSNRNALRASIRTLRRSQEYHFRSVQRDTNIISSYQAHNRDVTDAFTFNAFCEIRDYHGDRYHAITDELRNATQRMILLNSRINNLEIQLKALKKQKAPENPIIKKRRRPEGDDEDDSCGGPPATKKRRLASH